MFQKLFVRATTLVAAFILTVRAADATDSSRVSASMPVADSAVIDSASIPRTIPLLPEQLGPMESVMWSKNGLMRKTFNFPLTEDGREKEMKLRRTMLTIHEIGGFTTLAAMIATCIVGQMAYNQYPNRISPGLGGLKNNLAAATEFLYFGTASLAIFTPPPLVRRKEWSSVSTHKLLATIHFTGMIVTPILASYIGGERRPGSTISRNAETAHMISGYTTTAAFAAAMMVIVF